MENIISIEEFEPKNIVLNNPTTNAHGGTVIPIHYQCPRRGKIPFILKTPKCEVPYGVSQFPSAEKVEKGKEDAVGYSLNISFSGFDNNFEKNPKVGMFFTKLQEMEKFVHQQLVKNSKKFLKDNIKSVEVVEKMCYPIIKRSKKDGEITDKYPPTFTVKMRRYGKEGTEPQFVTKILSPDGTESKLTVDNRNEKFPRYSEAKSVLHCPSLQVVAKVSMPFNVIQAMVYPGKNQIVGNAFANDSDDESGPPVKVVPTKVVPAKVVAKVVAPVVSKEDDDEEEEDEEEEEEEEEEEDDE